MYLILVISGASASGSITITGVNDIGETTSETVNGSGNGTYYSFNKYSAVNASGLAVTGFTSGSLTVTGVYAWNRALVPSQANPPYTNTLEWFTGSESDVVPGVAWTELSLDFDVKKELKVSMKGFGQDKLPIGDWTTNPLTSSRVSSLPQPVDTPRAGWSCAVYLDPLTGTVGSTQFADMLNGKVKFQFPAEAIHTLSNVQTYKQLGRAKWDVAVDAKLVLNNLLQYVNFRQDVKQYLQLSFFGKNAGGGNIEVVQLQIPFKFTKWEVTSTPTSKYSEADISGIGEYDPSLGTSFKLVWNNSGWNPSFTS